MHTLVRSFKPDGIAWFSLLLMPIGVVIMLVVVQGIPPECKCRRGDASCLDARPDDCPAPTTGWVPFLFAGVAGFFLLAVLLKNLNETVDRKIVQLCAQFSDAQVTLAYHAIYTGLCKPKGTTQHRYLYISAGGPAVTTGTAPTRMSVTCPANCKAGDPIQITTPAGPMQVVVPAGVSEGMTFQVQTPAVAVASVVGVPMEVA